MWRWPPATNSGHRSDNSIQDPPANQTLDSRILALIVLSSWVLAFGWLVVGWLLFVCRLLSRAAGTSNIHQGSKERRQERHTHTHTHTNTHTTHARCFVCWWILDVTVVGIRNMIFVFTRADFYQFSYRSELNSMFCLHFDVAFPTFGGLVVTVL